MGVPVVLDSDDVEAILFATAAMKTVEAAVKQARDDPFAANSKTRIAGAHDRMGNAWRDALRRSEYPERFSPATEAEIKDLLQIWPKLKEHRDMMSRFMPKIMMSPDVVLMPARREELRELMTRGLIEFGSMINHMHWASSGEEQISTAPEQWMRLRPRGIAAITDFENGRKPLDG